MAATQGHTTHTTPAHPANETRDLYRQKYDAQLREWQAKMEEVTARCDKLGAQARIDMQPHLDTTRTKFEAAKAKLMDLGNAAEDTWEEVKRNADSAWNEFKSSLEGAYDALKGYGKSRKN
jgi:chromosome segregation ATPase